MTDIKKTLPPYYKTSRFMLSLCQSNENEFDRLYAKMNQFENNLSVDNADEDGVKAFEGDFRIRATSDALEIRKKRIKARFIGSSLLTEENLLNAIRVFDENAYIIKHIGNYSFEINIQKPEMLVEIMTLVEDIKPAHLAVGYSITDVEPLNRNICYGGAVTQIRDILSVPIDIESKNNVFSGTEKIGVWTSFDAAVSYGRFMALVCNAFKIC